MARSDRAWFVRFAKAAAHAAGKPPTFVVAVVLVLIWACSGPLFGFSDTWQLVINTSTTIITFLMVFLIQNTQNRDSEAMQLKLDELIRAIAGAQNALLDIEELDDRTLDQIRKHYASLARRARSELEARTSSSLNVEAQELDTMRQEALVDPGSPKVRRQWLG